MSSKPDPDEIKIEAVKQSLYEIYLVLHKHRHIYKSETLVATYTEAFSKRHWAWKVVGITRAALDELAANDFVKPKLRICRGHLIDRKVTVNEMFSPDEPLGFDEFWTLAIERDKTVLMTYAENGHGKKFPEFIHFDADDLFPDGVGVTYRKNEKAFLRKLHSEVTQP
jgi:hypothetical protein